MVFKIGLTAGFYATAAFFVTRDRTVCRKAGGIFARPSLNIIKTPMVHGDPPDTSDARKPVLINSAIYDKFFIICQHIFFVFAPEYIFQ